MYSVQCIVTSLILASFKDIFPILPPAGLLIDWFLERSCRNAMRK